MKRNRKIGLIAFAAVIALTLTALSLTGCDNGGGTTQEGDITGVIPGTETKPSGDSSAKAIMLTEDKWADGSLSSANVEQWFKFTATAANQFIHFDPVTFVRLNVQVYESDGTTTVGSIETLDINSTNFNTSQLLTSGSVYYIKVKSNSGRGGTYRIAFNTSSVAPKITLPTSSVTELTTNKWTNGNITTIGGLQWFKFTATATTQFIHFEPGTLTDAYIQLYDNAGNAVGSGTALSSYTSNISQTVANGSVYYIKVAATNYVNGTYKIAFNATSTTPAITLPTTGVTTLTANTWANGNIAVQGGEQWFKFTATATTQYIHFEPGTQMGTLSEAIVQLYDNSGNTVGGSDTLQMNRKNTSQAVTIGSVYYIKVTPSYGSGTYRIAFNTTSTAPTN